MDSEDDMYDVESIDDDSNGDDDSFSDDYEEEEPDYHPKRDYTVLSSDDIRHRQAEDIATVCSVLSLPRDSAGVLLVHYNWNVSNLHEAWFADEQEVRRTVGLVEGSVVAEDKKLNCGICFENYPRSRSLAAACGHSFCKTCWRCYITTSIKDGPACLKLRCPEPKCGAAITQDMINLLLDERNKKEMEEKEKYSTYFMRSYVEVKPNIKWCPAPDCDYAIDFALGSENYDCCCTCTHSFCWNCIEDAHRPLDCETVAKWIFKNKDETENVNWILANSKPCPKCKRPIQKVDGCMHMTCQAPCNYEFCWLCLQSYRKHGLCNKYNGDKMDREDGKKRKMAKHSFDRYAHYYERWVANQKSREKAITDLCMMRDVHFQKLKSTQCQPESHLEFITEAWQQIIECRRVLKWTYAYAYYLPEDEYAKRRLFEYLQGQAEDGLERLHHRTEKGLKVYLDAEEPSDDFNDFRKQLGGLTAVTRNYFENLVQGLENGLADVSIRGKADTAEAGSWSCRGCTYKNGKYSTVCLACSVRKR